ncbi:MAG: hypothetical protein ACPG05_02100 [Bdellovibrionales bacterium]
MKKERVGQDSLGNDLYVRKISKSGRIVLPAPIADHLRDKETLVRDANYKSDRDDLCVTFLSKSLGFMVDHFSSNYLLTKALKLGYGRQSVRLDFDSTPALNRTCAFSEELELSSDHSFSLSSYWTKNVGYNNMNVVVRRFEHGDPRVLGSVQILPLDVWNERFPKNKL